MGYASGGANPSQMISTGNCILVPPHPQYQVHRQIIVDQITFEGVIRQSYRNDIAIDDVTVTEGNCPNCGGVLNNSSGEVDFGKSGDEGELICNWTIGDAGIRQAVAIISLQKMHLGNCSEFIKVLDSNKVEVFVTRGCDSNPPGLSVEIPFGSGHNITLAVQLSYKYSNARVWYRILNQSLSSATAVSWNVTAYNITASSAGVRWSNFPLPLSISYYLVGYKETNSVITLFRANSSSNIHYSSSLKGYTSYVVQVFAFTTSINGNITFSSQAVSIKTLEGVPSRAPLNVRATDHGLNELLVEWDPLPVQYINGRLLGYRVYYKDMDYYKPLEKTDITINPEESHLTLFNIRTDKRYQISVAALTSEGEGPKSASFYITKGCTGFVNRSSGWLNFSHGRNTLNCIGQIKSAGMPQGVTLISFQYVYFSSCYPYCRHKSYIKVFHSNGLEVFAAERHDTISDGLSLEIPYQNGHNITLEVQFSSDYGYVKVWYKVLNRSLSSALPISNWSVSIANTTHRSIFIHWSILAPNLHQLLHYFGLVKSTNGSSLISSIRTGNVSSVVFHGLLPFRKYRLVVVGVNRKGEVYKSAEVTAWTKEGVPSRPPSNATFTNVRATEITVHWNPLPKQYVNGRLSGYYVDYMFPLSLPDSIYPQYNKSSVTVNPNNTWVTLTGLKPQQLYYIQVAAFTSKGRGPSSESVTHKTGLEVTVNQSTGFVDVRPDYNDIYYLTIGNVGVSRAVTLFLIQKLDLSNCSEYVKIFGGNGTMQFYQAGCGYPSHRSLVEVPFGKSNNITVNVVLLKKSSLVKMQFAVLKNGLNAATVLPGWTVSADNGTTRLLIQWTNLKSILNRQVLYYIILLNKTDGNALDHKIIDGKRLSTEIDEIQHSTTYGVQVFGVDELGRPYRNLEVIAKTKKLSCGSRPSISRSVGGTIAPVNSWPWQAMLFISRYRKKFCGASLIDPRWVVTAANCIGFEQPSDFKVRLGAHYSFNGTVGTEQDYDVIRIIKHKNYHSSNDIALLQLSKPANIGKGVGLVCLSDNKLQLPLDDLNKTCWITGWGTQWSDGNHTNELMQASIPLVSKQRCGLFSNSLDDSMICVGKYHGEMGACSGDSGGPLVCEFNGKWYLEGLASWGKFTCDYPYMVYAKIRHLKSWIISGIYPPLTSCDFDVGLCSDWQQSTSDVFNWTRNRGLTPPYSTGPSSDHTTGLYGYYMYIETSYPRVAGDNAKLVLSVPGNGELACLEFYYHMYGEAMGTLSVFSGNVVVFNISGDHGKHWRKAEVIINLNKTVTFEGIVGSSFTGDLAIDDVLIRNGSCLGETTAPHTTPSPETTPPTPSKRGRQEAVILKIQGLDIKKWNENTKVFKREVAMMATAYCAVDGVQCNPTSSFNKPVFSGDLVHILPGYPMQSPDDPLITLLAFYLQLSRWSLDNVVHRDVLKAIVKSDMYCIGIWMDITLLSVQPLFSTKETTEMPTEKDDKSVIVAIAASLGGVLLLVFIVVLFLGFKRIKRLRRLEPGRAVFQGTEGVDGDDHVYGTLVNEPTTSQESGANEASSGSTNGVAFCSQDASKATEEETKL
ncbi:uncharacterized protein LOC144634540 isoform X2 [Oculina patagonica]